MCCDLSVSSLCQALKLTRPTQAKVKASGYSPPLRTMRCMLSSCSLMCRWSCTRHNAAHSQLELELDTVARFLRCRSTELKVLATGRSPPPRGESLASPSGRVAHSCESCVLAGREAASCQSRRAAARPAALAHPVLALWCGRATASSNASRVRPSQAARHWPANCRSSEASEHISSSRNSNFVRVFVFPPEAHLLLL